MRSQRGQWGHAYIWHAEMTPSDRRHTPACSFNHPSLTELPNLTVYPHGDEIPCAHDAMGIRHAILQGLDDVEWANAQLHTLRTQREQLLPSRSIDGTAPTFSPNIATQRLRQLESAISANEIQEVKQHLRAMLNTVILNPTTLSVELQYTYPGPFSGSDSMGIPIDDTAIEVPFVLRAWFIEEFTLPMRGRKVGKQPAEI